jgi:hypothetical protein
LEKKSFSPDELFEKAGTVSDGFVNWGDAIPEKRSGVYIISLIDMSNIEFDDRFEIEKKHWNDGQEIIYIGRANQLARRLNQFYRHVYGNKAPHRGGQAILLVKDNKSVRWATTLDYAGTEHRLIQIFEREVGRRPFGNRMRSARMNERFF